jgi:fatty acid-binding protein DegV
MIKGLLFFEDGTVQQIGELRTAEYITAAMKEVLEQLITQEKARVLTLLTTEEIQKEIEQRSKPKQEIIEP